MACRCEGNNHIFLDIEAREPAVCLNAAESDTDSDCSAISIYCGAVTSDQESDKNALIMSSDDTQHNPNTTTTKKIRATVKGNILNDCNGIVAMGRAAMGLWETLHTTKHIAHVCLLASIVLLFEVGAIGIWGETPGSSAYPYVIVLALQLLRILPLLAFPQAIFNFLGMICFNAFPDRAKLKGSPFLAPFICIRVVTRGDYPELVRLNVQRNLVTCQRVGLENFMIEVVTDKKIDMTEGQRIQQVVVPSSYTPKSGALFKARALQYCLEEDVNTLSDNDWIVHLDEETIVTESSIRGILNFVMDGKHQFGQGLITYVNENIQNWVTSLADSFRVSDDMGKLRFQFKVFHKPLLGWKGSYVVSQVSAERRVTFDHGPDGSVAEDNYFGMVALKEGYTFDFIEGEMWEKSPFTISDFLQQRKRWLQGILLVVHSPQIPLSTKWLLTISIYAWVTMPLAFFSVILSTIYPVPVPFLLNIIAAFVGAVTFYMYIFGAIKSFRMDRIGLLGMILCVVGAIISIPFNFLIENLAVLKGLVGNKHKFYVVNKSTGVVEPPVNMV